MPPVVKNGHGAKEANIVSLIGGIVVAVGVFILGLLIQGEISTASVVVAGLIAAGVGVYVRVADM